MHIFLLPKHFFKNARGIRKGWYFCNYRESFKEENGNNLLQNVSKVPKVFRRYVDNIFRIVKEITADNFLLHKKSAETPNKFTMEK